VRLADEALAGGGNEVCAAAARALAALGTSEALDLCVRLMTVDANAAVVGLVRFAPGAMLPRLRTSLAAWMEVERPDGPTRDAELSAMRLLARRHDAQTRPLLRKALATAGGGAGGGVAGDPVWARHLRMALLAFDDPEAIDRVRDELVKAPAARVRGSVQSILSSGCMAATAFGLVSAALEGAASDQRREIAFALDTAASQAPPAPRTATAAPGWARDPRWAELAVTWARSDARLPYAWLLARAPHPDKVTIILGLCKGGPLAAPLLRALGDLGGDAARTALLEELGREGSSPLELEAAAEALARFGEPWRGRATQAVLARLDGTRDGITAVAGTRALRHIDDSGSTVALVRAILADAEKAPRKAWESAEAQREVVSSLQALVSWLERPREAPPVVDGRPIDAVALVFHAVRGDDRVPDERAPARMLDLPSATAERLFALKAEQGGARWEAMGFYEALALAVGQRAETSEEETRVAELLGWFRGAGTESVTCRFEKRSAS
jgi:hypothetical protein